MGDSNRIRYAFGAASEFLNPVLNRDELQKSQGKSLLAILSQIPDVSAESNEAVRTEVIGRALKILNQIHTAFVTPAGQQDELLLEGEREDEALEDAKRRRMLHALLDLISLEGIYPSLSSGVGIPLQQRVISVLPAGVIAKQVSSVASSTPHNEDLLRLIMGVLLDIASDRRSSIQPVIRGRILSDIISGAADLAFNPNMPANDHQSKFQKGFLDFVHDTPSAVLLPTLSSFLQSDTTAWFKSTVSAQISQVPLRPGGVLQTIMFIASQFAPSLGQEAQSEPSSGPHFTVQAIMQISRLLSSVPQGIKAESYFEIIAPQLLSLLDGDDPDLRKTASYTIGSGILGKRAFGAPGTTGHLIFIEPIFRALTAELNNASSRWMDRYADIEGSKPLDRGKKLSINTLVDDELVELAINRLKSLSLQHPNPGLVKRIIYPILVPLWGLACYSKEQDFEQLHGKVMALLQAYFGISVGVPPLKKLVDNLLWDGGSSWTYATASEGRVALRRRIEVGEDQSNLIKLIDSLQSRTELFVELLGSDPSSEERTGDIFLYVSETWLVKSHEPDEKTKSSKPQHIGKTNNIIQQLVSAKIAEKLLDNFKDTLSRRPLRVLELIKQVIDGELGTKSAQEARRRDQKSGKPSLSSLAHIVQDENQKEEEGSDKEASESLSTAFSLLSTVLASPDFAISRETKASLECIKDRLDQLIPFLPTALSKPATTSSMLLEIQLTSPEHDDTKPLPAHISDLETHRQALANLNSELPPIQAEGFSLLSKLIMNSSPVLDIPSTLTLLLSIITDISESSANEEFIYLNAIKLIGTLSSRHPRTVVKTLVDSYADKTEKKTLDQRLKIGESLLRTVQDLGEALTGETAKILGEGMVAVAGRRGQKPQAQRSRRQQEEKERRRQEREQRKQKEPGMPAGWSIPTGTSVSKTQAIADDDDDGDDISADESPEHAANVVAAWAAGASADEEPDDLRVRASALSILASAIQTNIIGLGPALISSAVSLALATITLEPSVESAILRRAGAVLILDILKAFDTAREERNGREIGFGFSLTDETSGHFTHSQDQNIRGPSTVGNIPSMLRTLGFVESRETDSIVRGHLRVLIESLEAWMEKSLMWGIAAQMGEGDATEPRLELGDRIAGLDLDPLAGRNAATRPRIEEIE
ncbi:uncharacterized protein N7459_004710 [Penicillium hispanicum]|uniref:uncharacterized protein n=1 Tax=Penicillium hispanicum TaxID=1080232 RepID=UPI0025415952|nr:uncharacterized protein N7459_004710 [Penicillium hispanicum]KAJ5584910.1 hypothetical protein N7459_004710 [Penicillium hispanicum]